MNRFLKFTARLDMFDRPFELSFEEGHRQTKLKQERYVDIKNKKYFSNQLWNETSSYGKELGELIEYERGSVFGGLMTVAVFMGFAYLLLNDIRYNLKEQPFTFEVKEKFRSGDQASKTGFNVA